MGLVRQAIDRLKDEKKKRLVENYLSLSVLQTANYLLPLITLPYLTRVLGVEKFGLVMFASALIKYFMLLTDYGFNLSATREIAVHRTDIRKVSEIFWSVITIKTVILSIGFGLLALLVFSFEKFRVDWALYFLAYGMVIGQAYFPIWFFQGMEKMKYITVLNITAKLIFTVLIFVVVRESSDYIYVLLINSIGFVVAGFVSFWIVLRHFKIRLVFPPVRIAYGYLKDSTQFFLSQASVMACTTSNTFALGIFVNNQAVAYYAAAEQLYKAMQGVFAPIVDALYPYMAKERNIKLYKGIYYGALVGVLIVSMVAIFFSEPITRLVFGGGFEATSILLKLFSLLIIVSVASILLAYPCLAALGYSRFANLSAVLGSILHLVLLSLVIPIMSIYVVVIVTIISESIVLLMRAYAVRKYELWRLHPGLQEPS